MRVGIDYRTAMQPMTGVGVYTYALLEQLAQLDSGVEYLLFTDRPFPSPFPQAANIRVEHVEAPNRFVWEQAAFPRAAARLGVQVLHRPSDAGGTVPRPPMPYVVSVHDLIPLLMRDIYLRRPYHRAYYYLKLAQTRMQADAVLTVSARSKLDLVQHLLIDPERVIVTHHGVRVLDWIATNGLDGAQPPSGLPRGRYILGLGGSEYRKNNLALVEAFARLATDDPTLRLVIVGGRWRGSTALHDAVAARGLADRVTLLETVGSDALYWLYRNAELFVFPSRYEGFGIPVLEAMAFETPVITTPCGALPEIAGDAALLAEPDDHEGIATFTRQLLTDAPLRATLIERGRNNLKRFSYRQMAEQTLAVYRKLGQRSQAPR